MAPLSIPCAQPPPATLPWGVLIRWNGLVEWNSGMVYWNSGMPYFMPDLSKTYASDDKSGLSE